MSRNKERNIVPQKQQEARKDADDIIKYEVAFPIISAVCRGGIARRRRYNRWPDSSHNYAVALYLHYA